MRTIGMAVNNTSNNLMRVFLFIVIYLSADLLCVNAQEKSVVAVLDFSRKGIMKEEMTVLTDVLIFNIIETGDLTVIGRMEGKKLLQAARYSKEFLSDQGNVKEIGKRLYADYIIGLILEKATKGYTLCVRVFDVSSPRLLGSALYTQRQIEAFINQSRDIAGDILGYVPKKIYRDTTADLVLESLSPVVIKERLLFILQKDVLTEQQAAHKEAILLVIQRLLSHDRFIPYMTEKNYHEEHIGADTIGNILMKRNCHYCAVIRKKSDVRHLVVYDEYCDERLSIPIDENLEPDAASDKMIAALEERLPFLPQETVVREVKKNILFEQKVEELLFSERLFSKKFSLSLQQSLFTSVFIYYYIPNINILSLKLDCYWYYNQTLGIGAGHGFSLVYPATFESGLTLHPLVQAHEVRLVPFSFRTGGKLGFLVNLMTTLIFQNAFDIIRLTGGDDFEVSNEHIICFSKTGIGMGIAFNMSESFAVSWEGLSFHCAIPISGFTENNKNAMDEINPFSLDIGGLGFIYRF
jgi:hypothetical protein